MFRFLTAGESHGSALVGILEGLPAGVMLDKEHLAHQMRRRKCGYGRGFRQKIEDDAFEILSGVRFGETTGAPIAALIQNKDHKVWEDVMRVWGERTHRREVFVPRPGHADWPGMIKYGHQDMRDVLERASARETAMRVCLGSINRAFLESLGIHISSYVRSIGSVAFEGEFPADKDVEADPCRCPDTDTSLKMTQLIDKAKEKGDTLGGSFEVRVTGVPAGLGGYSQSDQRLEGALAGALMSLNAIVEVELGQGIAMSQGFGSDVLPELMPDPVVHYERLLTGGLVGGMTTGEEIRLRARMKPISTLMKPGMSFDVRTGERKRVHIERSDTCAVPAASVISESVVGFVFTKALLQKFGGDHVQEIQSRLEAWRAQTPMGKPSDFLTGWFKEREKR